MTAFRRLVMSHRHMAMCLVLATLCMKLLVPTGFMPTMANGTITVSLCSGAGPQTMTIEIPGMAGTADHNDESNDHGKAQMTCAFSGLGLASLTPVDPIILVIAVAFVMAMGFAAVARVPSRPVAYLRPPLRGPPATA